MDLPNKNISQQAANRANQSVSQYGPEMEKMFYGMMQNGGLPDLRSYLSNAKQVHADQRSRSIADLKSSGIPLRSTAMAKAAGQTLGQADNQFAMSMADREIQEYNNALNRQFQGAAGLGTMPGYYAAPSSVEMSMIDALTPYHTGNLNAQLQTQMTQGQGYNTLMNNNWQGIDTYMMPSKFDQYVSPFLNPLLEGLAGGLPYMDIFKAIGAFGGGG